MTSTLLLPNRSVDSTQAHTAAAGHTVYRPTEGQLRWAQFHHRRRALAVRESVEALYQTPADRLDVEGALSEDDKSSSSGASSVSGAARGGKPKISRGRRALLRVSQRRLRQRSQVIHQRGFRRAAGAAPSSSSSEEDDQGDALDNIFAEEAVWKRRRRHKKRHSDDRGRRFDQAFHAIMMNFAAAQQPQFATIETPTKIWSRPAETPLVDVNYDAMKQMGISTGSRRQTAAGISSSTMPLIDRGASWLIHLPKTEKISNEARRVTASTASELLPPEGFVVEENVDTPAAPTSSPVRQRFRDIVTDFQTKLAPAGESLDLRLAPSMRLNKYFAPMEETIVDEKKEAESPMGATRLDFAGVQNRIHTFEKKESPSDEDELANILQSMDPDMLEEMEALNPGVKERLRALYLGESSPSVKQLARIIETPTSNEQNQKPEGLVQHFVTQMEQACQRESLMSADGKLHHHTFARLVNQYLLEANGRSPSPRRRQPMVESLVNKLQYSEETDSIIDDEGHLDRPVLEHLVTRYLAEVTGQNEDQIRDAEDWASLQGEDYHVRADFVHGTTAQMRRFVRTVVPRDEGAWREVVERSLISSLPEKGSTIPPPWAVQRLAERCAALIPAAWDEENVGVLQEIVGDTLAEAKQIQRYGFLSPQKPTSPAGFSTPRVKNSLPSPQIQRFVLQIEQAAEVEPLVQNGAFHLPTFSKLVNRYWTEEVEDTMDFNGVHSPLLLARAKRSSTTSRGVPQEEKLKSPGLVKRFLSRMEEAVPDKNLVNSRGRLDHNALEKVVTEQLLMAARFEDSDQAFDLGGESVDDGFASAGFDSPFSPADLDFFSMIRQNRPTAKAKSVLSELTVESPRRTVSMVESTDTEDQPLASAEPRDLAADIAAEKNIARNISGAVSNKVGSLFSRLFHKEVSEHQQKDDMQAVAAFRKSQGERRLSDETSSLSSFRALPEGIKNAVMNFRRISGASEQVEFPQGEVTVTRTSFDSESIASVPHSLSSGMPSEFSPERVKLFHRKVREQSALIGDGETRKSIIDTDGSEASHETMNPDIVASLMLSPTILTKRHQQAFKAIEKRNWDQVTYLISANPWLCEMTDVATNQYLLHKLALFGGGESTANQSTEEAPDMRHPPAPDDLNTDIVRLFPSSVHKFDQDGNLPLHMAAASANTSMATILGDRFPSGATVRNEDGLLPIHLAILACGSPRAAAYGDAANAADMIRTMMNYFPGSVAIPDNEGNLPIHTAVSVLRGDVGVDVIHLLLDEAARQLSDPYGARFRNKITLEDFESTSADTLPTETPTDSDFDDTTKCTMVLNDAGETPLMTAIHARGGWEVIEALIQEPGGRKSALVLDGMKNDALHLLVGEEYQDLAAALSILKIAPETARRRNDDGILPIEVRHTSSSCWTMRNLLSPHMFPFLFHPQLDRMHANATCRGYSCHCACRSSD
jgi:ankyrin repeat protein